MKALSLNSIQKHCNALSVVGKTIGVVEQVSLTLLYHLPVGLSVCLSVSQSAILPTVHFDVINNVLLHEYFIIMLHVGRLWINLCYLTFYIGTYLSKT